MGRPTGNIRTKPGDYVVIRSVIGEPRAALRDDVTLRNHFNEAGHEEFRFLGYRLGSYRRNGRNCVNRGED